MKLAVKDVTHGTHKTINAAAKAHKVSEFSENQDIEYDIITSQVACQMLSDCVNGLHKSNHQAHKDLHLLNEAQEKVVNKWLILNSGKATPLHPCDLCAHAFEITGKHPGKNWHWKYLKWHNKSLKTSKPCHLNPKHAQNFNRTNVEGYFRLQAQIEMKYNGIPPEHNWNVLCKHHG